MELSLQRLGDNPKDHENYKIYPPPPLPSSISEKIQSSPFAADYYAKHNNNNNNKSSQSPPSPVSPSSPSPPSSPSSLTSSPSSSPSSSHIYSVPSTKEYFMDLDFILNVISDGPTKTYAYRRLRYLESKW